MSWPSRSHGAGDVTEADVGQEVTVCGWVDRNRNLGGLGFMDVRDHTGLLQVGQQGLGVCTCWWGGREEGGATPTVSSQQRGLVC